MILFILFFIDPVSAGTVSGYFHTSGYYYGETGYHEWVDYCPLCGEYNCLHVGMKGIHDEISCEICGADYDGTNGKDKWDGGARDKLIRYVHKEVKADAEQIGGHKLLNNEEVLKEKIRNYKSPFDF